MHIVELRPMLRTWDIDATLAFYTETLGFRGERVDGDPTWANLELDGVSVMLAGPNHHEGDVEPAFTGSLYFTVEGVDELWERVKDHARICYPVADYPYGMREFGIYDNNGYLLQFGERIGR